MPELTSCLRSARAIHKLRYSKTIKGDAWAALLGLLLSLILAYLALSSVGACSVDLKDLYILGYYLAAMGLLT